jgi:hypothetical protein
MCAGCLFVHVCLCHLYHSGCVYCLHAVVQIAMGKVEAGTLRVGANVRVMPGNTRGKVEKVFVNDIEVLQALPGTSPALEHTTHSHHTIHACVAASIPVMCCAREDASSHPFMRSLLRFARR